MIRHIKRLKQMMFKERLTKYEAKLHLKVESSIKDMQGHETGAEEFLNADPMQPAVFKNLYLFESTKSFYLCIIHGQVHVPTQIIHLARYNCIQGYITFR